MQFCSRLLLPALATALLLFPVGARSAGKAAATPAKRIKRMKLTKLALEFPKMRTAAEADRVATALKAVPGVVRVIVDSRIRLSVVDYDAGKTNLKRLIAASEAVGVPARKYLVERRFPKPIKLKGG